LADSFPVEHMLLELRRTPELEQAFDLYIDSLTDKSSPNFRHWIMAAEQGEKYGLAQSDLDTITGWLKSHGLEVGYVYPNRMVIDFSGTAGEIREAFHTEIHELVVGGQQHFANMSDPKIPAALAPAIEGVVSLHNFKPRPFVMRRPDYTFACNGPIVNTCHALVPADFQTIYNLSPLYSAGITGNGETVAVVEDTNSFGTDWSSYRTKFGLTSFGGTLTHVHPNSAGNCTNPGTNGDDVEADLDVEMVTAFAPGANVELASCTDGNSFATFGTLIAIENLVNGGSPPPIISMSYGVCEAINGATANAAFLQAFKSAAAAGVSVFTSAGDSGASSCTPQFDVDEEFAVSGIGVTGWGETAYNVAVGGTDFEDTYNSLEGGAPLSTYWNSTNSTTFGSAKSYIPEIPWNDSCASFLVYHKEGATAPYGASGFCNTVKGSTTFLTTGAGGGGPSGCATGAANVHTAGIENTNCKGYAKPSWQAGIFGNPADGVRDIPDVSLFASNGVWNHFILICYSDTSNGGIPCTGAPSNWFGVGGTSAAAPAMAAIQALVNQKVKNKTGNPNPTYYKIAKSEFGSAGNSACYSINQTSAPTTCVFYDITQGDNDVDCQFNGTAFHADCYTPAGTNGVLGTQAIGSLTLKAGGSGYTSTPTCTISVEPNKSEYRSPTGTSFTLAEYRPNARRRSMQLPGRSPR
jgi:subtilase family serine protease